MNAIAQSQTKVAQRLNHVEFVHRPGERRLVHALFEVMGIQPMEIWDGEIILGIVDPPTFNEIDNDNVLAGREVRPEQWAFDQALEKALGQEPLASAYAGHKEMLAHKPQWGMHFGYHMSTLERWEAAVARLQNLETLAPELKGRAKLLRVFRPEDPDQPAPLHQAFLWTDILASGSLALGQRIELSARVN
jgi:hypothetical protein